MEAHRRPSVLPDAEWSATLGRYFDPPWEAACYLVDGHAICYAEQSYLAED